MTCIRVYKNTNTKTHEDTNTCHNPCMLTSCFVTADKMLDGLAAAAVNSLALRNRANPRKDLPMRTESTAQPFEAELDWYVENVVVPQARALGDRGALVSWMAREAAIWRNAKDDPGGVRYMEAHYPAEQRSRIHERDIALASLLEQLACEVIEARAPKTRH
jgi:hypothetical protein